MPDNSYYSGFAIAIAWPETYCKQPGAWYDALLNRLGISTHHYYKVGHAALVLIDKETLKCQYFDFGRYHSPFRHGRVRSEITDPGLKINTTARLSESGNKIENIVEILTELQLNKECHGEGTLHASYCSIDFAKSYSKALQIQQRSPVPYGPFTYNGSNCSRFVNDSIVAGQPGFIYDFRLNYAVLFTPTPMNNVNALSHRLTLPKLLAIEPFCPTPVIDKTKLKTTLAEPARHTNIPTAAQWLSGEGAGSWFSIIKRFDNFIISRFSPEGETECSGLFKIAENTFFDINSPYKFDHLSHCQVVRIKQADKVFEFSRLV
ncbi:MAG: hypothetical protein K0B15_01980 [Lentimicrobium sp.]|nr:hypothetical protein [Lentimicrobium sp.]